MTKEQYISGHIQEVRKLLHNLHNRECIDHYHHLQAGSYICFLLEKLAAAYCSEQVQADIFQVIKLHAAIQTGVTD